MKKINATRFPVARIKKLIQADEDVGKVASATPIVVSKALELFLGSLVAECVKDAEARGSNKITAYGLKRTITSTEIFDFCSDIVVNIPDPITEEVGKVEEVDNKKKRQRKRPTVPKMTESEDEGAADSGSSKLPPAKKRKSRAKIVKDEEDNEVEEDEGEGDEEEEEEESKVEEEKTKKEVESDYEEE